MYLSREHTIFLPIHIYIFIHLFIHLFIIRLIYKLNLPQGVNHWYAIGRKVALDFRDREHSSCPRNTTTLHATIDLCYPSSSLYTVAKCSLKWKSVDAGNKKERVHAQRRRISSRSPFLFSIAIHRFTKLSERLRMHFTNIRTPRSTLWNFINCIDKFKFKCILTCC